MALKDTNTQPPASMVAHMLGLYLMVALMLSLSWILGQLSFSFLWVFAIIFGLFTFWISYLKSTFNRILDSHKTYFLRKKALRQEETAEWLNFVINRWWVFSSVSIEDLVKRRINDRLNSVRPSFVKKLQLSGFTFGDITPSLRNVKAFECTDGVPGFKPASWSNIVQPPVGLGKMSSYQLVLEGFMSSRCDDFKMTFRTQIGENRVGLPFDISVEELQIKGTVQIVLHLSMEVPFPHITKATVSFIETPEVWFNVKVLRSLNLMEVPLLKSWLHLNVMEGLTKALVDPGKIDIPIAKAGPINAGQFLPQKPQPPAQGVLTIYLKGTPSQTAGEELCYKRLSVCKSKRQTIEVPATQSWEDCCSFFVYNLASDKLKIKCKCKRLLTTVTLEEHLLELAAFPFQVTKQVNHEIENKDGSMISLQMDYSPLPQIDFSEEAEPVNVLQHSGVLYVCVHCANNVIVSDSTGSSDPYCVVFCDRRRVLTTPYVTQNTNPSWESFTEFFVKDFTQCQLSFYVFDWDGTNNMNDDFLGSAIYNMSEREPYASHKTLVLGYNKHGEGQVKDISLGQVTVSVVFRPVTSVERSERYRLTSTDSYAVNNEFLYVEDMVSPGTMSLENWVNTARKDQAKPSKKKNKKTKGGGAKLTKMKSTVNDTDFLEDKIFVDLTLVQGRNLVAKDRNGYSDPFCEVKLGKDKVFSSSVRKRTLDPQWNETVSFQMTEDSEMLEIQVYDKDMFVNDFMGKVMLSLDQLKELSLQGTKQWFELHHIKSGEIQLKCTLTTKETLHKQNERLRSETEPCPTIVPETEQRVKAIPPPINQGSPKPQDSPKAQDFPNHGDSLKPQEFPNQKDSPKPVDFHQSPSIESDVFEDGKISPTTEAVRAMCDDMIKDALYENNNSLNAKPSASMKTSTPYKNSSGNSPLRRSVSDVKLERRSRSSSLNSFAAFNGADISTVHGEPSERELLDSVQVVSEGKTDDGHGEKLYNVFGKVLSVQGLSFTDGHIYCKVRALSPHKHRLRQIFANRVIAKSPLVRALEPVFNTPFEIDRGMGVSGDLLLKFDVKRESKETLASQAFPLRALFNGPGGEADKVQKVLRLENNIQLEIYLEHSIPDSNFLRRRSGKRSSNIRSFRQ